MDYKRLSAFPGVWGLFAFSLWKASLRKSPNVENGEQEDFESGFTFAREEWPTCLHRTCRHKWVWVKNGYPKWLALVNEKRRNRCHCPLVRLIFHPHPSLAFARSPVATCTGSVHIDTLHAVSHKALKERLRKVLGPVVIGQRGVMGAQMPSGFPWAKRTKGQRFVFLRSQTKRASWLRTSRLRTSPCLAIPIKSKSGPTGDS